MSELLDQEIRTLQSTYWSERDPDGLAFAPLADAYLRKGEVRDALDLLTDGTARHPEYATGHVVATRLYMAQGMHSEAELAARRVLELDEENICALSALATILDDRGQTAEAEAMYGALMAADPESEEARSAPGVKPSASAGTTTADQPPADTEVDDFAFSAPAEEPLRLADDFVAETWGQGQSGEWGTDQDADTDELPVVGGAPIAGFEALDLDALAPEPEVELEAMDLGMLAPDPEPEAELEAMDLGMLAPDPEPEVELEAVDLGMLAPDPEPEVELEAVDLGMLAPDPEPEVELEAMDLGMLAPDPEPEVELEAMDLGMLAPDPEPEVELEAMDLGMLAPDPEPEVELEAMDLGMLAPDPEPEAELEAMDLGMLAPDPEPDAEVEAMDLGMLAPDPEPEAELEAMDLGMLAPDPEPEAELEAMDLGMLAPDPEPEPAPEIRSMDLGVPATDGEPGDAREPIHTRTLAELYVKQGFTSQALAVYRSLSAAQPDAEDLRDRIAELESGGGSGPATGGSVGGPIDLSTLAPERIEGAGPYAGPEDEEVETLAKDLAGVGDDVHDVDTPFAWTDDEPAASVPDDDSPVIGDYFDNLLGWEAREEP